MTADRPWDTERVARWLGRADRLDAQLRPVSDLLFDAARLGPGERVLDVGCGHGPTTRRAASLVGPGGAVTGLDLAAPMIEAAASMPPPAVGAGTGSPASIDWVAFDAAVWNPPPDRFDVVISRFGVMFFSDPTTAFTNLARAVRPGGRLATATWANRGDVELFDLPYRTARDVALAAGDEPPHLPVDEGPYSLPDERAMAAVLGPAGWVDVRTERHDVSFRFDGGVTPEEAARGAATLGPARFVLEALPEHEPAVIDALVDVFRDHVDATGHVVLTGTVALTTASRAPRSTG